MDLANIEKGECVIGKVSRIVNSIRHSNLDSELLLKSVGFRLPVMNATRWSSQHNMISIFLNAMEIDPSLPTKLNAFHKLKPEQKLTPTDIKILKELVLLLEPFKEATDELQADYETLGCVIPAYLDMLNKVSFSESQSPLAGKIVYCKEVARALKKSLVDRLAYVLCDEFYILGNFQVLFN